MIVQAARLSIRVCIILLGVVLILLALFTGGARIGLPLLANYKGVIEDRVEDYFRSPVDIGQLSLSWEGMGPLLRAEDVTVQETLERKVSVDALLIDVNLAKSLLRGIPVINELTLIGARLAIEADDSGKLLLHGLRSTERHEQLVQDASLVEADKGRLGIDIVAWLLNARRIALLDTHISVLGLGADSPLVIDDLNIWAENEDGQHHLQIQLTLPAELGGFIEAGYYLKGDASRLTNANGEIYASADALNIGAISQWLGQGHLATRWSVPQLAIDTQVSGNLWAGMHNGKVVSVHGPVSTGAVVDVETGKTLFSSARATVDVSTSQPVKTLVIRDASLQSPSGESFIERASLSWHQSLAGSLADWAIDARGDKLALDAASTLPASLISNDSPAWSAFLFESEARGWVRDWRLRLDKRSGGIDLFAEGDLDRVQIAPTKHAPGFGPVDGRIEYEDAQGRLTLSSDNMALPWPAITDRALHLDSLNAALTLDARDRGQVVVGGDIALKDRGIDVSTRLSAALYAGKAPFLDVHSRYHLDDITQLKQWLPRKLISPSLAHWLDSSLQGGSAENGTLLFFGNTAEFPFSDGEGVFQSRVNIREGQLKFLPNWPAVHHLDGTLELDGLSLKANAERARLDRFELSRTTIGIDHLLKPSLSLEGTGSGKLQDIVDFAVNGPLKALLEPVLNDVTATGRADMDLTLSVPLYRTEKGEPPEAKEHRKGEPAIVLNGSLFMDGNRVNLARANVTAENVRGAVGFDQQGVRINNLRAQAFDSAIVLNADTDGIGEKATTTVNIHGVLKGSDVLAHYGSQLDQFLRGASSWQVELHAPHSAARMASEGLRLRAKSNLVGTRLMLPRPLDKRAAESVDFELSTAFRDGSVAQEWDIRYTNNLHVNALAHEGSLESLLVHVGTGSLTPAMLSNRKSGIQVSGEEDIVALDRWVGTLADYINSLPATGEQAPILAVEGELKVGSLQLGDRVLGAAVLTVATEKDYLNVSIDNASVAGLAQYPREHWTKERPMKVQIDHLDSTLLVALSSGDEPTQASSSGGDLDPRLLPPIEARIRRMTHKGYTVRQVVLRAQPDASGLTVTTLGFAYQTMRLVGSGYWRMSDPQNVNPDLSGQQTSRLNLTLQGDDFGQALHSIGIHDAISEGEGSVQAQLSWLGPLYAPQLSQLNGQIELLIERGNIIPLEPGAGRVVGLFALQALPRRLEFDFKDMTADGLAFKRIAGNIEIKHGIANVGLVQLTGPIGVVDITGQSNLNTTELNQHIAILPRVSAALPVIAALSGGATAGIATVVATGFLKALGIDIDRVGLRSYSLTGKWDDPVFEPVDSMTGLGDD